ncbi:hypothetical protein GGS21DRAFT_507982 [Xylaria nigripes]|nr:hypothetical protein GGS21DRAFT_507982 [Xylaria nigripes]
MATNGGQPAAQRRTILVAFALVCCIARPDCLVQLCSPCLCTPSGRLARKGCLVLLIPAADDDPQNPNRGRGARGRRRGVKANRTRAEATEGTL